LEAKILVYLGEISYSVYLTHMFVAEFVFRAFLRNGEYASPMLLVSYVAMTVAFSAATYRWIEVPFRKRLHNVLSPHRHGAETR
jgi:peptidoglycan/LPS O-acetylase OafA/YrhL